MATTKKHTSRNEDALLKAGLSKYGKRAYNTSLKEGYQVAVLRGNSILTIDPDGEKVKIATIEQTQTRITQRVFNLK